MRAGTKIAAKLASGWIEVTVPRVLSTKPCGWISRERDRADRRCAG